MSKYIFPACKIIGKDGLLGLIVSSRYPKKWETALQVLSKYGHAKVTLEPPEKPGSNEQNNTFHALINEYWISGCSSFETFDSLRNDMITCRGTQAVEHYVFQCQRTNKIILSKTKDSGLTNTRLVGFIAKSWSNAKMHERQRSIDQTIKEMKMAGVNSAKFEEILRGIHG